MTASIAFSANTGFLYPDLPFLERIRAAARDGFDAVEFHDEGQDSDRGALLETLAETALPVTGLNVRMGPSAGCSAIPGERDRARREIDEAVALAEAVGAGAIHVLAGKTDDPAARATFLANLSHALGAFQRTILIEPLCSAKMPDYWLNSLTVAASVCEELAHPRLKILFDTFHVETEHGETALQASRHAALIGHVQIASVPGRHEPASEGDVLDWPSLLSALRAGDYQGRLGCEYVPSLTDTEALAWRERLRGLA